MKTRNLVLGAALTAVFSQSSLMAQPSEQARAVHDQAVPADPAPTANDVGGTVARLLRARSNAQLRRVVEQADLVFRGVVKDVQYRMSAPAGPERTRIPFTYVTYWVDEVINGQLATDTVTLQFIGGLDENSGRYMAASHVPQFDLDDEDILFVQGNTERLSPLVGGHRGRLRVVDGRVYTETGGALRLGAGEALEVGARYALDEVATTTVRGNSGELVIRHRAGPDTVDGPSDAVTARYLIDRIRALDVQREDGWRFVNADLGIAPTAPDLNPAPPPQSSSDEGASVADDRGAELERRASEVDEMEPQLKSEL